MICYQESRVAYNATRREETRRGIRRVPRGRRLPAEPLRRWLIDTYGHIMDTDELALLVGVDRHGLAKLLDGNSFVNIDTVDRITMALGVSIDAIYPDM